MIKRVAIQTLHVSTISKFFDMNYAIKVLAIAFFMINTFSTFGQGRGLREMPHRPSPIMMIDHIGSLIELSDEQQAQLDAIKIDYKAQIEALKLQEFEDKSAQREAFHSIMASLKETVQEVLTPEQIEELASKRKVQMQERRAKFESIDREALREELKAYHEENIRPVMVRQRLKLEELIAKEDKALIDELRATVPSRKEIREERIGSKGFRGKERPELTEEQKENREKVKGLLEKYEESIRALMEEFVEDRE